MYERFEQLLKERGISAYRVAKDTKITTSLFSQWKSGKNQPKTSTLQKVADYFGVSLDWLLGNTDIKHLPNENNVVIVEKDDFSAHEKNFIEMYRQLPKEFQKLLDENLKAYYNISLKDKLNDVQNEEKAM